ncbi:four helix bundle protein [Algoriphagus halophytocola]|uniref:Four helix bundle protein n=1 Tax=Algoriphagus halophytocola TaxID=2991499 RepID=A0ABY6MF92_9BACT|nr:MULTISPECIES: four helix bundle protein [unclassified Algoriphagus]UZD22457.1 four helix bundle protein [Algoriphagus sp. TR-M5]WBL43717.1 four helix bundle protein [Algoriphagus sp. TR-M9]
MTAKSFEELRIWQKAIKIGDDVYQLTDLPPLKNDYKSRNQLIGALVSISNNIAKGFEYNSRVHL